jgi:hypothetical protein
MPAGASPATGASPSRDERASPLVCLRRLLGTRSDSTSVRQARLLDKLRVVARTNQTPARPWYHFGTQRIVRSVQIVHGCGRLGRRGRSGTHRHQLPVGWGAERSLVQIQSPRLNPCYGGGVFCPSGNKSDPRGTISQGPAVGDRRFAWKAVARCPTAARVRPGPPTPRMAGVGWIHPIPRRGGSP